MECVSFDSAEEIVVAGATGGTVKLWDLEQAKGMHVNTPQYLCKLAVVYRSQPWLHCLYCEKVAFCHFHTALYNRPTSWSGQSHHASCAVIRTLTGHRSSCLSVDFHPFGDFFASGSLDTSVKVWDVRRKACINTYKNHSRGVTHVQFSPDGRLLTSGGQDGALKVNLPSPPTPSPLLPALLSLDFAEAKGKLGSGMSLSSTMTSSTVFPLLSLSAAEASTTSDSHSHLQLMAMAPHAPDKLRRRNSFLGLLYTVIHSFTCLLMHRSAHSTIFYNLLHRMQPVSLIWSPVYTIAVAIRIAWHRVHICVNVSWLRQWYCMASCMCRCVIRGCYVCMSLVMYGIANVEKCTVLNMLLTRS